MTRRPTGPLRRVNWTSRSTSPIVRASSRWLATSGVEQIDHKSAHDVVTEVDHLSEALILDGIRAAFPGDALLAEETGEHDAAAGESASSGIGRVWVVDPLDGTINYANGIPMFCVSIALVVDGVPVVGVVRDPARNESFAATVGGPATLNGHTVSASAKDKLSDFVISMSLFGPGRGHAISRNSSRYPGFKVHGIRGAGPRLRGQRPL